MQALESMHAKPYREATYKGNTVLTLTHHVNEFIGAYWYSLEGEILDSEGNSVVVAEGTAKLTKINKAVKFYKDNGFLCVNVKHMVKQD